jgi:hypothetical protein
MMYQTEAKPQSWRAVAVFDDRADQLLYLNRSAMRVREGLRNAFFELLDEEERAHVRHVSLQRWQGAPDAGRWQHQSNLAVPTTASTPAVLPMSMMMEEQESETEQVAQVA